MGSLEVVNVKGIKERSGITYVGRSFAGWTASPLGNPFRLQDMTRGAVIRQYRLWLWKQMQDESSPASQEIERLATIAANGEHVKLGCWCAPESCHADVIKACIEWKATGGRS